MPDGSIRAERRSRSISQSSGANGGRRVVFKDELYGHKIRWIWEFTMTKFFITVRSISNDQFDDDLGAVRYLAVSDGVAPAGMYRKPCRALIWPMSVDNRLWWHLPFMANCSSLALPCLSRLSPNTWPRKATRPVRVGARSCAIICRTSRPWICSWFRPSTLSTFMFQSLAGSLGASLLGSV